MAKSIKQMMREGTTADALREQLNKEIKDAETSLKEEEEAKKKAKKTNEEIEKARDECNKAIERYMNLVEDSAKEETDDSNYLNAISALEDFFRFFEHWIWF